MAGNGDVAKLLKYRTMAYRVRLRTEQQVLVAQCPVERHACITRRQELT
jgi:hypothetical protein